MQVKSTQGDTTSHSLGWLEPKNRQWQVLVRILWSEISQTVLTGMQNGVAAVENSLSLPPKVKYRITTWLGNSTPRHITKGNENIRPCRNLYTNVHRSIIHNSQKWGNNPHYWSTDEWRDKTWHTPTCMLNRFSCVWLCDPTDYSSPGFSVHGILQERILEWVAMPFSRGSSRPRDRT